MTLTLTLPPEVEEALAEEARRKGTTPEKVALDDLRQLYVRNSDVDLKPEPPLDPTLALWAQWEKDDPVTGPEDLALRQREGDELMAFLLMPS